MNEIQYARLMQHGLPSELCKVLGELYETKITMNDVIKKIKSRQKTPPPPINKKKRKYIYKFEFKDKFFAKLECMPSVPLQVKDSISQIRKSCYGFREKSSLERVYLKIDKDSILEFRVSPASFIVGKRYFMPRLEKMYEPKTWVKVNELLNKICREYGIKINTKDVEKYKRRARRRYKLANALVARCMFRLKYPYIYKKDKRRCSYEKTWK